MGEFFGTDGIRGVAGKFPLDKPTVELIGFSLAAQLRKRLGRAPKILTGRDTRESGDWIDSALARGACAGEAEVSSVGVITTPGVAYLTRALNHDAGVVISASHNPYEDNGIKIFVPSGCKLDEATEQAIEQDLKAASNAVPHAKNPACKSDPELRHKYLGFLRDEIGNGLKLDGYTLVVDCANGAAYELAPALFRALGAQVHAINNTPNGQNINLDCGSLHPERLQKAVREYDADVGLAFDGDADRLLLIDSEGNLVDGDQVLFIMARQLQSKGLLKGSRVVGTVMSNIGLERCLREQGIELVRVPVGDKYVLEELLTNGGVLGGEQSGHIIFPEISKAGDGMITALEILRVVVESKKSLAQLRSDFKCFPQVIVNVRVSSKPPLKEIPPLQEAMAAVERTFGESGRLVVRYSGTENVCRVMLEGPDEAQVQHHANNLAALIRQHIG